MKFLNSFWPLFISIVIVSQNNYDDYSFTLKLLNENRVSHAMHYLKITTTISPDSIKYLKGLGYYLLKRPDSASFYLSSVQSESLKLKAYLLASLNYAYIQKNNIALEILNLPIKESEKHFICIKNIQLAGNFLILKNYAKFDSIISQLQQSTEYRCKNISSNLILLKNQQLKFRKKSMFLAGFFSAIVPGAGKLYAGRKGESISMFIANFLFASFTFEAYYRTKSITSPQCIIFGSLFSFFYSGNIIGSIYAAKRQNISKQKQIQNEILANMHMAVSDILD